MRLLHGMEDPDVPHQISLRLAENLPGTEAVVELIEDGDHRLSRPEDLGAALHRRRRDDGTSSNPLRLFSASRIAASPAR